MHMERFRRVILGGGMVAGYALKEMVKLGVEPGDVCVVSMDEDLPYVRPSRRRANSTSILR